MGAQLIKKSIITDVQVQADAVYGIEPNDDVEICRHVFL